MLLRTPDGEKIINMDRTRSIGAFQHIQSGLWDIKAEFDKEDNVKLASYITFDDAVKVLDAICSAYITDGVKIYTLPGLEGIGCN